MLWALLMLFLAGGALGEGETESLPQGAPVTIKLSADTKTNGNKPYAKDGREYVRDMTVPLVDGLEAFFSSRTSASVTYFCPCAWEKGEVVLSLPGDADWTTIEINGQLLTPKKGVQARVGEDLTIRLGTKNKRSVLHLTLTALPVIEVSYTGSNLYENDAAGVMTVYDPAYAAHGQESMIYSSEITIKFRGQSSLSYDKHGYSVHLKKYGGQNKMALLGLREDDDWILDGAMNDMLRVRNSVAMDLWSQFYTLPWNEDVTGAITGQFCEVFMNGRYIGVYCLNEKLDRKQTGIDKDNGRIIRSVQAEAGGVNLMGFEKTGKNAPSDSIWWYNMEIKFPKEENTTAETWDELYAMLSFICTADDEEFALGIGEYLDLDNLAAYYVYITALGATGNMVKNLYFIMPDASLSDAKFILLPWDVDGSFGRRNDSTKREIDVLSTNNLYDKLMRTNAGGFNDLTRDWWMRLGGSTLSYDNIMATFQKYYDVLESSGAYAREAVVWPEFGAYKFNAETELAYIDEYMKARYEFVNSYFIGDFYVLED